jgi:hypothetical protein
MTEDRRSGERVPILGALPAELTVLVPMTVKEIGPGGLTVETTFSLNLNSLHDLRLPVGDRVLVLKGRVVHSRISDVTQELVTYSTGFDFVDPPERLTSAIAEYLATLKATRAGA